MKSFIFILFRFFLLVTVIVAAVEKIMCRTFDVCMCAYIAFLRIHILFWYFFYISVYFLQTKIDDTLNTDTRRNIDTSNKDKNCFGFCSVAFTAVYSAAGMPVTRLLFSVDMPSRLLAVSWMFEGCIEHELLKNCTPPYVVIAYGILSIIFCCYATNPMRR